MERRANQLVGGGGGGTGGGEHHPHHHALLDEVAALKGEVGSLRAELDK